ncbi:MAG: hypothetical protein ACRDRH_01810 [Pseudonocardia sp.]
MFAAIDTLTALQAICDQLDPATIEAFAARWFGVLPHPLTEHDHAGGYWWEIFMCQVRATCTIITWCDSSGR